MQFNFIKYRNVYWIIIFCTYYKHEKPNSFLPHFWEKMRYYTKQDVIQSIKIKSMKIHGTPFTMVPQFPHSQKVHMSPQSFTWVHISPKVNKNTYKSKKNRNKEVTSSCTRISLRVAVEEKHCLHRNFKQWVYWGGLSFSRQKLFYVIYNKSWYYNYRATHFPENQNCSCVLCMYAKNRYKEKANIVNFPLTVQPTNYFRYNMIRKFWLLC